MADLIINKYGVGYGESPLTGFGDIRNCDPYSTPGAIKINNELQITSQPAFTGTFTADPSTDQINFSGGHTLVTGAAITVSTSGTLPSPLVAATIYYVSYVSSTDVKLATSLANLLAGTFIDITTAGTGTQTLTTVNMGRIRHFTDNPSNNNIYCVDDNGRVWYVGDFNRLWVLIDGNTRTNANGNGICVWKNYLLVFRNAFIDVYGNLNSAIGARTWTNNWIGISSATSHHAIWGLDDILYFCNGTSVASLQEGVPPFVPATPASYVYTAQALNLPSSYNSFRLEELGGNLMVAANTGVNVFNSAIFPWDRFSTTFDLPIKLPFQLDTFLVYNNVLYIFAPKMLRIYATNGSYITEIKRLPPAAFTFDAFGNAVISGVGMYQGRIHMNVSGRTGYAGVFSLNLQAGQYNAQNALTFDNTTSPGITSSSFQVLGFFVPKETGNFYVAWYNSLTGSGGIDSLLGLGGAYNRYDNFEALIESPLIKVGNTLNKANYNQIEIALATPLLNGQAIRLSYRTDITSSYTLINSFDTTNIFNTSEVGAHTLYSFNDKTDIRGIEYLQIKIELDASGFDTPQLIEIRLRE